MQFKGMQIEEMLRYNDINDKYWLSYFSIVLQLKPYDFQAQKKLSGGTYIVYKLVF